MRSYQIRASRVFTAMSHPVNPSTEESSGPPPSELAKAILRFLISYNEIPSLAGLIHFIQDCLGKDKDLWALSPQPSDQQTAQTLTTAKIASDLQKLPDDELKKEVVHANLIGCNVDEEAVQVTLVYL